MSVSLVLGLSVIKKNSISLDPFSVFKNILYDKFNKSFTEIYFTNLERNFSNTCLSSFISHFFEEYIQEKSNRILKEIEFLSNIYIFVELFFKKLILNNIFDKIYVCYLHIVEFYFQRYFILLFSLHLLYFGFLVK